MKITTKFDLNDRVITPLSERPGVVWDIRIVRTCEPKLVYRICIEWPRKNESKFDQYFIECAEHELRSA